MSDAGGFVSSELTVVWLLLIAVVVATYFIQAYRITLLPPSSSALLLGVFFGIVSRIFDLSQPLRFSPAAFFYALLPPIVFAAGFTLKKRAFFDNIGAILTYSILGTVLSCLTFGIGTYFLVLIGVIRRSHLGGSPFAECLMYGAAISSIDPVATLAVLAATDTPPVLYNLVFGESVLNDAVSIVLFRSLSSYSATHAGAGLTTLPVVALKFCILAAGSLGVGVGVAMACAFLLKKFDAYYSRPGAGARSGLDGFWAAPPPTNTSTTTQVLPPSQPLPPHALDPTIYEIAIVVMGSYLAYLVAEVMGFSGIVALFFTGICHAHYSYYNVATEARIALRRLFEVGAFLCELFVFAYLGLQVATNNHSFDFGLIFSAIPLAVASRAANVFPCSRLINTYRTRKFPRNLQRMMWCVGLRGAVAYGLVVNMPRSDVPGEVGIPAIETAALLIVFVSTLVLGSGTAPLLRHLELEGRTDAEIYEAGWTEEGPPGQPQPPVGISSRSTFHEKFKEIDEGVLKPLFGGRDVNDRSSGNDLDIMYNDDDDDDVERDGGDGGGGVPQQQQQQGGALRRPLFGDNGDDYCSPSSNTTALPLLSVPGVSNQGGGGGGSSKVTGTSIPSTHHHHLWDTTASPPPPTTTATTPAASSPRETVVRTEVAAPGPPQQQQQNTSPAIIFGDDFQ